jgi:hypothetical protein
MAWCGQPSREAIPLVKRTPLRVRLANPEAKFPWLLGNTDVEDNQPVFSDFSLETLYGLRYQCRIRLNRNHPEAALKVVGGIVAIIHSDVVDQIPDHRQTRTREDLEANKCLNSFCITLVKNSDFEKSNEEPPWREDAVDESFNFLAGGSPSWFSLAVSSASW